jgi:hypothetical protein
MSFAVEPSLNPFFGQPGVPDFFAHSTYLDVWRTWILWQIHTPQILFLRIHWIQLGLPGHMGGPGHPIRAHGSNLLDPK